MRLGAITLCAFEACFGFVYDSNNVFVNFFSGIEKSLLTQYILQVAQIDKIQFNLLSNYQVSFLSC